MKNKICLLEATPVELLHPKLLGRLHSGCNTSISELTHIHPLLLLEPLSFLMRVMALAMKRAEIVHPSFRA